MIDQINSEYAPGSTPALLLLGCLGASVILLVVLLELRSQLDTMILALFAIGGLWLATRMPVSTIGVYWVLAIVPNLFMLTPIQEELDLYFYSLKPADMMLIIMSAAVALRVFRLSSRPSSASVVIGVFAAIFLALIAYAVLRNLEKYGIRAPGEFRHRYLLISAALYGAVYLDTEELRLRMLRVLSSFTVCTIFCAMPLVAMASGWIPGTGERLFPAEVSLAFLFGISAILLMKWNGLCFWETRIVYLGVPFGMLQIVLDNHRSVWLAAMVVMAFLLLNKQLSLLRLTATAAVFVLVSMAGRSLVSVNQGRSFGEFMTERALAFTNPEADGTASWRIQQWELQLPKFRENPVVGIGLGGYWGNGDNLVAGNLGVMPHNYYVGTLVKLGGTGLAAYLCAVLALTISLFGCLRSGLLAIPDKVICLLVLLVIFGAHAYYSAYWLDASSWIWIGLGAAVSIHFRRPAWLVPFD